MRGAARPMLYVHVGLCVKVTMGCRPAAAFCCTAVSIVDVAVLLQTIALSVELKQPPDMQFGSCDGHVLGTVVHVLPAPQLLPPEEVPPFVAMLSVDRSNA